MTQVVTLFFTIRLELSFRSNYLSVLSHPSTPVGAFLFSLLVLTRYHRNQAKLQGEVAVGDHSILWTKLLIHVLHGMVDLIRFSNKDISYLESFTVTELTVHFAV